MGHLLKGELFYSSAFNSALRLCLINAAFVISETRRWMLWAILLEPDTSIWARLMLPCWAIAFLDTLFRAISFHLLLKIPPQYRDMTVNGPIASCLRLGFCGLVTHWLVELWMCLCSMESRPGTLPGRAARLASLLFLRFPAAALSLPSLPGSSSWACLPGTAGQTQHLLPCLSSAIPETAGGQTSCVLFILLSFQQDSITWKHNTPSQRSCLSLWISQNTQTM